MSTSPILFDSVWKKFERGERHDSLRDLIPALVRRMTAPARERPLRDEEFWALEDVSFEVPRGEALGIIGRNGAGKSTVLKLLNRILKPTRGTARVTGRSGALIEVAAGFHPDLTGRENVYLQGAIMGMRRAEIAGRFDEIVAFAGVERFDRLLHLDGVGAQRRLVQSCGQRHCRATAVQHLPGQLDRGAGERPAVRYDDDADHDSAERRCGGADHSPRPEARSTSSRARGFCSTCR